MDYDEFNKKQKELREEFEKSSSLYSYSKKNIIQDDICISKNKYKKSSHQNKKTKFKVSELINKLKYKFTNISQILKQISECSHNKLSEFYKAFMVNPTMRSDVSDFCGKLINIIGFCIVIYCLVTPIERINYFFIIFSWICLFIFNYLYYRLWFEVTDVCPRCRENNAIYDEGQINKEIIKTEDYEDEYEIGKYITYQYTYRKSCRYCDYHNDSYEEERRYQQIKLTPLGFFREENRRHEQAIREENERNREALREEHDRMLYEQQQENKRRAEEDLENRYKANEDFIRRQEESWERRMRGY